METPFFSICIPNYNYAHYIGETIESILNQSFTDFEIIVVDNASTDNSLEVVRSYQDPRIRIIENQYNVGFAPNLQKATETARGRFVNLLSSDDKMRPEALQEYHRVITQAADPDNLVLFADAYLIDGASKVIGYETNDLKKFSRIHHRDPNFDTSQLEDFGKQLTYQGHDVLKTTLTQLISFGQFLTIFYAKSLWDRVEGYHSIRTIGPDKFFNYKLLSLNPQVIYCRQPLFEYRSHGSPNEQAQKSTVKQQVDDYLNTLDFSPQLLENLGISRDQMIRNFLNRVCLKSGLTQLVYGTYKHAFRLWAFGLATYPSQTLGLSRFYVLTLLLLLGPIGKLIAKPLYKFKHNSSS